MKGGGGLSSVERERETQRANKRLETETSVRRWCWWRRRRRTTPGKRRHTGEEVQIGGKDRANLPTAGRIWQCHAK